MTTASGQRVMARIVGAPRLWTLNSIGVVDSHWGFSYFSSSVSRASSPVISWVWDLPMTCGGICGLTFPAEGG